MGYTLERRWQEKMTGIGCREGGGVEVKGGEERNKSKGEKKLYSDILKLLNSKES